MPNASSMAELMAKHQSSLKSYKKGEQVTGIIKKLTSGEILVDIGAKTEAVVLEKDKTILHSLLKSLKVGDSVNVSVLNPESDQGNPVVSLRRFIDEQLWGKLDKLIIDETPVEVNVMDLTKGGFLVTTTDGVSGFLPNSQMSLSDSPQSFVGKKITVQVLEINRSLHKIIFSQKAAVGDEFFSNLSSQIKPGEVTDAKVSSTAPFGVFVSVMLGKEGQAMEGFIHLSELSWDKIETAENYFKAGDIIKAQILGIDKEAKRVNLSVKRLTKDPFEELVSAYPVDRKTKGEISKINSLGITVKLEEGLEGLIKKDKVPPGSTYKTGDILEVTVSEIDAKRHRIVLVPVLKEKPIGYR